MRSQQLSFGERKVLEKYMAMPTDELIRELNLSLLPNSGAANLSDMLRGRFFLKSDLKTISDPSILSPRTELFLSEVKQTFKSNSGFLDSLEKVLIQQPSEEVLITLIYDHLDKHLDTSRDLLRVATYICRVGIKEFLS